MPRAARDAEPPDDRQDEILGGHTRAQLTAQVDGERARLALQQALRREHVTDLGGADAEGERPDGAVRAGVAVAAHDGLARLREAQLRANDVHDAALTVGEAEQLHAELGAVRLELAHLPPGCLQRDRRAAEHLGSERRRGMIHGGERALGAPYAEAALAQHREGLRGGDLVDQVQVDVEHGGGVRALGAHLVSSPHLVEQGLRRARHRSDLRFQPEAATRGADMST